MKKIFILLSILNLSLSTNAQFNVVISGISDPGGKIQIKHDDNNNDAFTGITNGSGVGLHGWNTSTAGIAVGVRGTSSSIANGTVIAGATGVYGHITSASSGNFSAGVRGINSGTGYVGAGVVGYQAGAGWGVYGETPGGFGIYGFASSPNDVGVGVRGETMAKDGAGVEAMYSGSGTGTALEIGNGAIRVTGTNKAAFIHTTTAESKINANRTFIDNSMCNEDPYCLLFITPRYVSGSNSNFPIGVFYNTELKKWEIFNQAGAGIPTNAQFNVLVIKQ